MESMDEITLVGYIKEIYATRTACMVLAVELDSLIESLTGVLDFEVVELLSGISSILRNLALNLKDLTTRISDIIE